MDFISKKGIICFTFDDVLIDTSYELYKHLISNTAQYGKFLSLFNLKTPADVHARENQKLLYWLMQDNVKKNLTNDQMLFVYAGLYGRSEKEFILTDFYQNASPTQFALSTIGNPMFVESPGVCKIYILVKYKKGNTDDLNHKLAFIKKWFGDNEKFIIVKVPSNSSYSVEFKTAVPKNWDLIITDDTKLVETTASGDIDHKEYMMPRFGYNAPDAKLIELIKQKTASITRFDLK